MLSFYFLEKRRAVYDQFGEEGLKGGVPNTEDGDFVKNVDSMFTGRMFKEIVNYGPILQSICIKS